VTALIFSGELDRGIGLAALCGVVLAGALFGILLPLGGPANPATAPNLAGEQGRDATPTVTITQTVTAGAVTAPGLGEQPSRETTVPESAEDPQVVSAGGATASSATIGAALGVAAMAALLVRRRLS